MAKKPTYEQLEQKIKRLEKASLQLKNTEGALRESEKKYQDLTESLLDAVYEFDLEGKFTYVNEATVHMFGYSKDEILNDIRVEDVITEEEKGVSRENIHEISKGKTFEGERLFVRKDGTTFIGEIHSGPLYKGKEVVGVRGVLRDITHRKGVDKKLQESQQEKETILNTLVEHVIHEDKEMKILWANQAACESAGLTREELIGRHCYEIWPQRSDPCPDCPVIKAMETCQPQEIMKCTPDGRAWFIRGYPLQNASRSIIGAIETTLDITDRKQAEAALRESEEKYRHVVESVRNVGILVAQDGKLVFANNAISDFLDYTKDELISHPNPFELIHPDDRAMVYERHMKRLKGEKVPELYPYRIVTRDGSVKWVEVTGVQIKWKDRPATLNFFIDITERKKAEEALQESEKKYRDLVENISDVIYSIDTNGVMTYISPAIESVLGYSPSEIIGRPFIEFIYKEDLPRTRKRFEEILSGHTKPAEYRLLNKFREIRWILVSSKPVSIENQVIGIQGVLTDITERKQAEIALQQNDQKLERQTQRLQEVNTALKVLLEHREEEKRKLEENILLNIRKLIFPYIEKLENSQLDDRNQMYIDIIRSNLKDLISPFANTLCSKYSILTSTEIQVTDHIKHGRTSKEIASLLNVSPKAVSFHRGNIRRKLGLVNKKINLRSYLQSLAT